MQAHQENEFVSYGPFVSLVVLFVFKVFLRLLVGLAVMHSYSDNIYRNQMLNDEYLKYFDINRK